MSNRSVKFQITKLDAKQLDKLQTAVELNNEKNELNKKLNDIINIYTHINSGESSSDPEKIDNGKKCTRFVPNIEGINNNETETVNVNETKSEPEPIKYHTPKRVQGGGLTVPKGLKTEGIKAYPFGGKEKFRSSS